MSVNDMDHIDLEVMWELLRRLMRNNASAGDPARFKISGMVHEFKDENGDADKGPDLEELRKAVSEFRRLPRDEQQRLLGGWSPKVLDVRRHEHTKQTLGWPLRPVLLMWAGARDIFSDPCLAEFDAIYDEDARTCRLAIKAGSTKAEVLDALDVLQMQIDTHWDRLITDPDPLNEQRQHVVEEVDAR